MTRNWIEKGPRPPRFLTYVNYNAIPVHECCLLSATSGRRDVRRPVLITARRGGLSTGRAFLLTIFREQDGQAQGDPRYPGRFQVFRAGMPHGGYRRAASGAVDTTELQRAGAGSPRACGRSGEDGEYRLIP